MNNDVYMNGLILDYCIHGVDCRILLMYELYPCDYMMNVFMRNTYYYACYGMMPEHVGFYEMKEGFETLV